MPGASSSFADVVSHSFEWDMLRESDCSRGPSYHKSKAVQMRVFGRDVFCVATLAEASDFKVSKKGVFSYELSWPGGPKEKPVFYAGHVSVRDNSSLGKGRVVWADWKTADKTAADGGGLRLVSSADVLPRGEGAIEAKYMKRIWPTKLTACFRFQFGLREDDVGDWRLMPAAPESDPSPQLSQQKDSDPMPTAESDGKAGAANHDDDDDDSEVTCGHTTFYGNKSVLAEGSEVFRRMLAKQGAGVGRIRMKDCTAAVAETLMDFLYSGFVPEDAVTLELLYAAKKYEVAKLEEVCLRVLRKKLNFDNVQDERRSLSDDVVMQDDDVQDESKSNSDEDDDGVVQDERRSHSNDVVMQGDAVIQDERRSHSDAVVMLDDASLPKETASASAAE